MKSRISVLSKSTSRALVASGIVQRTSKPRVKIAKCFDVIGTIPPPCYYQVAIDTNTHQQQLRSLCSARSSISSAASSALSPDQDEDDDDNNVVEFRLADIGEGIAEVEIMQWFVEPGDVVHQFDRVCEVQSDKATVEITSRYDGQVRKLGAQVGDMLKVGKPLLYIATSTRTASSSTSTGRSSMMPSSQPNQPPIKSGGDVLPSNPKLYTQEDTDNLLHIPSSHQNLSWFTETSQPLFEHTSTTTTDTKFVASPAVRKLGKEYNINLAAIQGTGPQGRLLKSDVMKYVTGTSYSSPPTKDDSTAVQRSKETEKPLPSTSSTTLSSSLSEDEETTVVPLRGYNRLMYQRMTESLSVPHMTYGEEIKMTNLIAVRSHLKSVAMQQYNLPNLTFLPFFLKASSLALLRYPILNSRLSNAKEEDLALIYHKRHHIGVAMDTPRGLVVAVVRDCQEKSVIDIALDLHRLQSLAKEGNLSESDVSQATFSISNIGAIGGTYMSPVVIPPTVAIGAIGRIQRVPCIISDNNDNNNNSNKEVKVEAVDVMNVSWGADHRVIDGATLARFSNAWKGFVENPTTMILTLR